MPYPCSPIYVTPDDTRLAAFLSGDDQDVDGLRVIGYAAGGRARAYPVSLLDDHELVNDTFGGKPVTIGW